MMLEESLMHLLYIVRAHQNDLIFVLFVRQKEVLIVSILLEVAKQWVVEIIFQSLLEE